MRRERIFTDNPLETIWSRLASLQSINVSKKVLEKALSTSDIPQEKMLLHEKATGLSLSLRSAEDYFAVDPRRNLTTACLSYYYGLFSLMTALLLSDLRNQETLKTVEKQSPFGHGLRSISNEEAKFPFSEVAYLTKGGFLSIYLKNQNHRVDDLCFHSKPKDFNSIAGDEKKKEKIVNLYELFARIPEIQSVFDDIFHAQPLYLSCSPNERIKEGADLEVENRLDFSPGYNSEYLTKEDIIGILPFVEEVEYGGTKRYSEKHFHAKVKNKYLSEMKHHVSAMCTGVYIKPLFNVIDDYLVINFITFYLISIIVRYKPNLWREILEGDYDEFRALILNHLLCARQFIPNIVLNRIYEKDFIFSGHGYWE